jgi:hypothetical protein
MLSNGCYIFAKKKKKTSTAPLLFGGNGDAKIQNSVFFVGSTSIFLQQADINADKDDMGS